MPRVHSFITFETESWTLWAYGWNYVSVGEIEVVTIASFFDFVLNQEHTHMAIQTTIFYFTSSLVLYAHITMSWDILWLYKAILFPIMVLFKKLGLHAPHCAHLLYTTSTESDVFLSGINLCHDDVLMTFVIWHIFLINMRVFFNIWCRHENDHSQPKIGLFEYLSGWISYKLCQTHSPKIYTFEADLHDPSLSYEADLYDHSTMLWCSKPCKQINCLDSQITMSSRSWYRIEQTVHAQG
jgi:hypothetical protein